MNKIDKVIMVILLTIVMVFGIYVFGWLLNLAHPCNQPGQFAEYLIRDGAC